MANGRFGEAAPQRQQVRSTAAMGRPSRSWQAKYQMKSCSAEGGLEPQAAICLGRVSQLFERKIH